MSLTMSDILKTALVCAATIVAVLLWVYLSGQTKVPRSTASSGKIALRIAALYAGVVMIFTGSLKIPIDYLLLGLLLIGFVACIMAFDSIPGDALGLFFMIPLYILQQFILGFPDYDKVVLAPPDFAKNHEPPPLACDTGVVVAMLRPMGNVELAGERFSAASFDGKMLEVGTPIRVCGRRGNVLLVIPEVDQPVPDLSKSLEMNADGRMSPGSSE